MNRAVFVAISIFPLVCLAGFADRPNPTRQRITGIDHVRVYASNLEASRAFYRKVAGLPEGRGCPAAAQACFSVDDHQRVELAAAPSTAPVDWVAEIAFATDDLKEMRRYLVARGVVTTEIAKDADGAQHFELHDPEGTPLAFVQRPAAAVRFKPSATQVGHRLFHAGFVVKDRAAESHFYLDLLNFRPYWYGGFKDDGIDWYEIQVPDGSDWIEYMLNIPANADHKELGVQNHFSLGVENIQTAVAQLHKNGLEKFDGPEIGRDGKWGLDAYDPDGTRVEVMEFTPAGAPCCHPYTAPHPKP